MLQVTRERTQIVLGQTGKEEPMSTEGSREELSVPQKRIIDGFDEVAKGFASGTISRRRALKLTGTALLGGGLLAMFPGVAGAQSIVPDDEVSVAGHRDPGCKGEAAINNSRCPNNVCGRKHGCQCAVTVGGNKRCVRIAGERCPRRNECNSSRQCPGNQYCIKVGGCCGHPGRHLCVEPCGG
jgi:hypothetical protein